VSAKKLKPATVRSRLLAIEEAIARERDRHVHTIALYRVRLRELQARCSHENVTYYPDAAGGFLSFHQCDDCGKELPKSWKPSKPS
jgi:hypothetical protein